MMTRKTERTWVKDSSCVCATPPALAALPRSLELVQTWFWLDRWVSKCQGLSHFFKKKNIRKITTTATKSLCSYSKCFLCLSDSSLITEMWSILHRGSSLHSPPWCWCCSWPGSGSSSSTLAASECLGSCSTLIRRQRHSVLTALFPQLPEDVGLWCSPVWERTGSLRGDPRWAPTSWTNELRRRQRAGAFHPHGGALVHTRPSLYGWLGDACL